MQNKLIRQFKKGALELAVLKLLSHQEMYGYQMLSELGRLGEDFIMKEGTLYPILYRLEDDGLVQTRWEQAAERGVPRKFYTITRQGQAVLESLSAQWLRFAAAMETLLLDEGGLRDDS